MNRLGWDRGLDVAAGGKGLVGHAGAVLLAWCANTLECLHMALRPGNAGANDAADHLTVFTAALAQLPATMRRRILVRIDGAGASGALLEHFSSLNTRWRRVLLHGRLGDALRRGGRERLAARVRLGRGGPHRR
ncbi:hypothetical protein [Glycomyces tarimensis]